MMRRDPDGRTAQTVAIDQSGVSTADGMIAQRRYHHAP